MLQQLKSVEIDENASAKYLLINILVLALDRKLFIIFRTFLDPEVVANNSSSIASISINTIAS